MGQPVTTNPFIIMLINMTIVFGVLFGIAFMIRLIHLIDPTKEKKETPVSKPVVPVQTVATAVTAPKREDNLEIIAVIAGALAVSTSSELQIKAIRPLTSGAWKQSGRIKGVEKFLA